MMNLPCKNLPAAFYLQQGGYVFIAFCLIMQNLLNDVYETWRKGGFGLRRSPFGVDLDKGAHAGISNPFL